MFHSPHPGFLRTVLPEVRGLTVFDQHDNMLCCRTNGDDEIEVHPRQDGGQKGLLQTLQQWLIAVPEVIVQVQLPPFLVSSLPLPVWAIAGAATGADCTHCLSHSSGAAVTLLFPC